MLIGVEVTGNGYCCVVAKRPHARTEIATVRKKAAKADGMTGYRQLAVLKAKPCAEVRMLMVRSGVTTAGN